jgi:glycosyltransferase involved in cell wall biosynthesis
VGLHEGDRRSLLVAVGRLGAGEHEEVCLVENASDEPAVLLSVERDDAVEAQLARERLEAPGQRAAADDVVSDGMVVRDLRDRLQCDGVPLLLHEAADGDQEGAPVALMEAHACGLPVVSTTHAGIPEIVLDGTSGLLVPENDPSALAAALRRLISDDEGWPALGAAGRAHVEQTFDVAPCTEELLDIYALAMSGRDDAQLLAAR